MCCVETIVPRSRFSQLRTCVPFTKHLHCVPCVVSPALLAASNPHRTQCPATALAQANPAYTGLDAKEITNGHRAF